MALAGFGFAAFGAEATRRDALLVPNFLAALFGLGLEARALPTALAAVFDKGVFFTDDLDAALPSRFFSAEDFAGLAPVFALGLTLRAVGEDGFFAALFFLADFCAGFGFFAATGFLVATFFTGRLGFEGTCFFARLAGFALPTLRALLFDTAFRVVTLLAIDSPQATDTEKPHFAKRRRSIRTQPHPSKDPRKSG